MVKSKPKQVQNPNKIRNLKQYKDLPYDDFLEAISKDNKEGALDFGDIEERIEEKFNLFAKDYDLSDLKFNDKESLRNLRVELQK